MRSTVAMLALFALGSPACASETAAPAPSPAIHTGEPAKVVPVPTETGKVEAVPAIAEQPKLPERMTVDTQLLLQALRIIGQLPSSQVGGLYQTITQDVDAHNELPKVQAK